MSGYVLSREAVHRFVTAAMPDNRCRQDNGGAEDVEMGTYYSPSRRKHQLILHYLLIFPNYFLTVGKCMELVEVQAGDSRDSLGKGRFFPFLPQHFLIPGHVDRDFWYWKYIYYPHEEASRTFNVGRI